MDNIKRTLILIVVVLYVLSPLDFMPGILFDDLIAIIIGVCQIRSSTPRMIETQER